MKISEEDRQEATDFLNGPGALILGAALIIGVIYFVIYFVSGLIRRW